MADSTANWLGEIQASLAAPVDQRAAVRALFGQTRPGPSLGKPKVRFDPPPRKSQGAIRSRDPSVRERITEGMAGLARALGLSFDEQHSYRQGNRAASIMDWSPVGNIMGLEEGATTFERGLRSGDAATAGLGALSFLLSAAPGSGPVTRRSGNVLAQLLGDTSGAIRAWHVSPHDFDRFSLDHLGSGEGAQAYGRGLYFAESPDGPTANHYRRLFGAKSKTYEVDIDAGPEHLLDYDAPSWEQPEQVQRLMREVGMYREKPDLPINETPSGRFSLRDVWGQNAGAFKTRTAAEARAREMIDGMGRGTGTLLYTRLGGNTYFPHLDDGSATRRLLQEGVRGGRWLNASGEPNLVVFDDSLIDILRKY